MSPLRPILTNPTNHIGAATVPLIPAFGGIGGTAAANTGFPAAKSGSHLSSRRQTPQKRAR
ncbi:MAG: hypothetical protein J0L63_04905 [Anaerolineae bacterium]|nr:hypothetical protein [Anaerolineae bacterium]